MKPVRSPSCDQQSFPLSLPMKKRKVLAEFLDWRASEEKRHQDYLIQEMSEAERRCIEAEFERLHCCWRSGSAPCCGGWLSWTAPSQLPMPKNHCGWPRGLHSSTDSSGSWRPGACPSLSEMRFHLSSGLPKQLDKSLSSCHQSDALWRALVKFRVRPLCRCPARGAAPGAWAATRAARTAPPARCASSSAVSPSGQLLW
ncbi:uncharacterized protein LOC143692217 isoform X4 [Agelaius phoeniceus]|uniref:uncharacterized protein LOC143692217 isoform X4 n=1 Tax=Agelaius phoeniceus TaxID=39638 RepID=UPI004054DB7E